MIMLDNIRITNIAGVGEVRIRYYNNKFKSMSGIYFAATYWDGYPLEAVPEGTLKVITKYQNMR